MEYNRRPSHRSHEGSRYSQNSYFHTFADRRGSNSMKEEVVCRVFHIVQANSITAREVAI